MNTIKGNRSEMLHAEVNVLLVTFRRLLRRRARTNLEKLALKTHPADLALLFRHFSDEERLQVFIIIQKTDIVGEFLTELDESIVQTLLEPLDAERVAVLLEEVSSDDRADILNLLPEEKASAILKAFDREESEELEELMSYAPDTAGGIMSVDPFFLPESTTATEAVTHIQSSEDAEMVFYLYVTDENEKLTGVVSLRDLVVAPSGKTLGSIMQSNVVSVTTDTDQEEVARQVSQYNLLAIPVVDADNTLLGIVTVIRKCVPTVLAIPLAALGGCFGSLLAQQAAATGLRAIRKASGPPRYSVPCFVVWFKNSKNFPITDSVADRG